MPKNLRNIDYSKLKIDELYQLVKNALVEEQIYCSDKSKELSALYEELADRQRLDVYDDAVNSAINQSMKIKDLSAGLKVTNIREFSWDNKFELSEFLKKTFKEHDRQATALKFAEILKIIGFDDSSFTCNVSGQSMIEANIFEGDTLIVNRSKTVKDGDCVVVKFGNEILVKRYINKNGEEFFVSENSNYSNMKIQDDTKYEILGVVKSVIHKL